GDGLIPRWAGAARNGSGKSRLQTHGGNSCPEAQKPGRDKAFDRRVRWWQASAPHGVATPREPMESRLGKTDLGAKQSCPNCGAKFYDLNRRPAVCPKCTTAFDPSEEGVRARRGRSRVSANDSYDDDDDLDTKKKAKAGGDDDDEDDEDEESEETSEIDVEADA